MFPSSIHHVNHKPYISFKLVHRLFNTSFKFASTFLHFSFRFYIVSTMYVCHICDEKPLLFVHYLINTIKICPCSTRCGNMRIVERILKGTTKRHCTRTRHGKQWLVNGAKVEIFSNCFYIEWNLTWIDYSYALTIWAGFWIQIWLTHPLFSIINSSCKPYPQNKRTHIFPNF